MNEMWLNFNPSLFESMLLLVIVILVNRMIDNEYYEW